MLGPSTRRRDHDGAAAVVVREGRMVTTGKPAARMEENERRASVCRRSLMLTGATFLGIGRDGLGFRTCTRAGLRLGTSPDWVLLAAAGVNHLATSDGLTLSLFRNLCQSKFSGTASRFGTRIDGSCNLTLLHGYFDAFGNGSKTRSRKPKAANCLVFKALWPFHGFGRPVASLGV